MRYKRGGGQPTSTNALHRINERSTTPYKTALDLFRTINYDHVIREHNKLITEICNNPLEYHKKFRERLFNQGGLASFPEFEGVVAFLTKSIYQNKEIDDLCSRNGYVNLLRQSITVNLISIQLNDDENVFNHLVAFPYQGTVIMIEQMLSFLDIVERGKYKARRYADLYHTLRYRSHLIHMLNKMPENILFPTCYPLGATDLIKIRCVPILFLGVTNVPVYADHYINTPLDFFTHDVQHVRRQYQEDYMYMMKHKSCFQNDINKFYQSMHDTYLTICKPLLSKDNIPRLKGILLQDKSQDVQKIQSLTNEEMASIQQWIKMLLFEIIHEKAWPLTNYSLCRNIKAGYDHFPIEIQDKNDKNKLSIRRITIHDPTTLANLYYKLRHGFYDDVSKPHDVIVSSKFRKAIYLLYALRILLKSLSCSYEFDENSMLDYILDTKYAEEFVDEPSITLEDKYDDFKVTPKEDINKENEMFTMFVNDDCYIPKNVVESLSVGGTGHRAKVKTPPRKLNKRK